MYGNNKIPKYPSDIKKKLNQLSGWKNTTTESLIFCTIWSITVLLLLNTFPYLIILTTLGLMIFPARNLCIRIYNSQKIPHVKGPIIIEEDIVYHKWSDSWYTISGKHKKAYYISTVKQKTTAIADRITYKTTNIGHRIYIARSTKGTKLTLAIAPALYKGSKKSIIPCTKATEEKYFDIIESAITRNPIQNTESTEETIPFHILCPECGKPMDYRTGVCPKCGMYTTPDEIADIYYDEYADNYTFEEEPIYEYPPWERPPEKKYKEESISA